MATQDNVRALRQIWLLGGGGLNVLRGYIVRETSSRSQALGDILQTNRYRFDTNTEHYLELFPTESSVNADILTWDMSLLILVIRKLFWTSLSQQERNAILVLKTFREDVQSDRTELSLMDADYNTSRRDITSALRQLTNGLDQQTQDEIRDVINRSGSNDFDVNTAMQHVQELNEFKTSMLNALNRRFEQSRTNTDEVRQRDRSDSLTRGKECPPNEMEAFENLSTEMQGQPSFIDIASAGSLEVQILHPIPDEASQLRRPFMCDEERQRNIERMVRAIVDLRNYHRYGGQDGRTDLVIRLVVESDDPSHAAEAETALIMTINNIIIEEDTHALVMRQELANLEGNVENVDAITDRVVSRLGENIHCRLELVEKCLELLLDFAQLGDVTVMHAGKGSVLLTVRCQSFEGVSHLLQFIESERFHQSLIDLSKALELQTGTAALLTAHVTRGSLRNLEEYLEKTRNNMPKEGTVLLKTKCADIAHLFEIKEYLETDRAKAKCQGIAGALSRFVGGRVNVTVNIGYKSMKQILGEGSFYPMKDWKFRPNLSVAHHSVGVVKKYHGPTSF